MQSSHRIIALPGLPHSGLPFDLIAQERFIVNQPCSRCGAANTSVNAFCPHCGLDLRPINSHAPPKIAPLAVQNEQQPIATTAKLTPLRALGGAAGMGFMGAGCGIWLVIFGVLLSLTGIGAIIGIPLILAGLGVPVVSTLLGLVGGLGWGMLKGKCPHCDSDITAAKISVGMDCPACKKRLLIRNKKFVKVE